MNWVVWEALAGKCGKTNVTAATSKINLTNSTDTLTVCTCRGFPHTSETLGSSREPLLTYCSRGALRHNKLQMSLGHVPLFWSRQRMQITAASLFKCSKAAPKRLDLGAKARSGIWLWGLSDSFDPPSIPASPKVPSALPVCLRSLIGS